MLRIVKRGGQKSEVRVIFEVVDWAKPKSQVRSWKNELKYKTEYVTSDYFGSAQSPTQSLHLLVTGNFELGTLNLKKNKGQTYIWKQKTQNPKQQT